MANQTKPEMIVWLARNRGKLTEIALSLAPKVTPQFVGQVARGLRSSKDGKIERALRANGAPL